MKFFVRLLLVSKLAVEFAAKFCYNFFIEKIADKNCLARICILCCSHRVKFFDTRRKTFAIFQNRNLL